MKIRKLLPLVLLAIGAIFLLSSCDALLDAIYANNTITVTPDVSSSRIGYSNVNSYVVVTLSGATGGTQTAYLSSYTGLYGYYDALSFSKLPNGNFTVTATFYGYSGGLYYQYPPVGISLSMPYNGSNTADVVIYP